MTELYGIFGGLFTMAVIVIGILLVLAAMVAPLYIIAINTKLARIVVLLEELVGDSDK